MLKHTQTDRFLKQQPELILPMDTEAPINACWALKHMLDNSLAPASEWATTALFLRQGEPLQGEVVHKIVQTCMGAMGLRVKDFGTHSLRAGGGDCSGGRWMPGGGAEGTGKMVIRMLPYVCEVCIQCCDGLEPQDRYDIRGV
jgi:hypothetical protein